jgi:predicted nuclease of predicted toxin-antitoxin system
LRFLLDEALSPSVAQLLAEAGHDAIHARDLGLISATDPIVLRAAIDDQRVLVTADTDFGTLLARSGDAVPSVIVFRGEVTRRPAGQA